MVAFVASLIVISGAQAGIPVAIDANPEWAIEAGRWTERLKQWAETVKHYENQINAYKQELLSKRHCCKVSDEAAFCLIQRPYISKTLLTRRISPRGSP